MKVLVIGSGAREHALVWKLKQSKLLSELYAAPGNPGIGQLAALQAIQVDDLNGLVRFAEDKKIDLTIVGPELPLTLGVVDRFQSRGLKVFGPCKAAAQLEGSKSFAKAIMKRAGVKTANYQHLHDLPSTLESIEAMGAPIVLKADGLAAGKGVVVCHSINEARAAASELFKRYPSNGVVLEQFLSGVEASFIVATNGETIVPLASSHDYKRVFDNDQGPNTGGMGSVSPTPRLTPDQESEVIEQVIIPVLKQLRSEGIPFSGFLYAGLMISSHGEISVLEFNTRLGDPETQSILARADFDLLAAINNLSTPSSGDFKVLNLNWKKDSCVTVVLAAKGYPDEPKIGDRIDNIPGAGQNDRAQVFQAGTKLMPSGEVCTAGGRVLCVSALGLSVSVARDEAYRLVSEIDFEGKHFRKDIGL